MIVNKKIKKGCVASMFLAALLTGGIFFSSNTQSATTDTVQATISITVCGNGIQETGEDCDGSDLNDKTCTTQGFSSGALACLASCDFNTSSCISGGGGSGGGGGGGGGGSTNVKPRETSIIFSGRAYPMSRVVVLKDGQIAVTTVAGPDSLFDVSLYDLSTGNYNFSLYGVDSYGRKSSLFAFPVYISKDTSTHVSGIFIAPTIAVDKTEVELGDNISIFGQTSPESDITIAVNSESNIFAYTSADDDGIFLYNFDTSVLEVGDHSTKAKSSVSGVISNYSKDVWFYVTGEGGNPDIITPSEPATIGDFNTDSRINIVDFSILAYWYQRPSPPTNVDLNGDNKITLVDLSILAYYWTG